MKKILIMNILLVIFLNSFYICFAKENNLESNLEIIKYEKDCQNYLIYQGIPKTAHYAFYEKDGMKMPAYCINPEYTGVNSEMPEYAVSINGKIKNEKVWKAIVNGYPYKTIEELGVNCKEEAYTATQFAIYTVLHNRNVADYTHDNTDGGKRTLNAYLKIMENVNKMNKEMNLEIEIESTSEQWELDDEKNEYLSKEFIVKSNISDGFYEVNLKGESADKLEIISGEEEKNSFKVNEKFKI
ncbi:MAG: thioester domain-containing protein, partial [Mycoplasmataceae bacterium]|nr:thioester domain-containing protein [Mycoplasmataceae bacterium]